MLGFEWDLNTALEVEREEALEEGFEKGIEKGIEKTAMKALAKGASIEFVKDITGFDDEVIKKLQEALNTDGN